MASCLNGEVFPSQQICSITFVFVSNWTMGALIVCQYPIIYSSITGTDRQNLITRTTRNRIAPGKLYVTVIKHLRFIVRAHRATSSA